MKQSRQNFVQILPHSAFGVTMLTIASIILLFGFFAHDVNVPPTITQLPDSQADVADECLPPGWKAVQLSPRQLRRGKLADNAGEPEAVAPAERYGRSSSSTSDYVAMLTKTCGCRWAEDANAPAEGSRIRVGQTLNIAAGVIEIAFTCGAKAILEGPAILELHSSKTSSLRTGRMTADVPDHVEGFTVHTPSVQLVSLRESRAESAAKLTATVDCVWAEDSLVDEGAGLYPGQSLKLVEGMAEITFHSGAKVILQGPAHLEIESAKGGILHSGRLTADVPDELKGFKIRTPTVEIRAVPSDPSDPKSKDISPAKSEPPAAAKVTTPATAVPSKAAVKAPEASPAVKATTAVK